MKSLTQRTAFVVGVSLFSLLSIISCSGSSTLVDVHGFSNLALNDNTLWFGAGYKLYRVDLNQQTAPVVYETNDIAISFVQIDGERLFFGGHPPSGSGAVIWSLDLDSANTIWKQEIQDNLWGGSIVAPPLIDNDIVIVTTRTALHGIDKTSGEIIWAIENNWFGTGELLTPILADEQLIYGIDEISGNDSENQTIAIVDPSSGKTLRTISMPGNLGAIPAVHGDCLFVKDYQYYKRDDTGKPQWIGELRLNCIDLSSGTTIWTYQGNGVPAASQIGFHNGLVLDVFANRLHAIDEQTGVLHWKSPGLEAAARNPQIIEGANLIALEIPASKKVVFLDPTTGKLHGEELLDALSSPIFIGQEAVYGTPNAIVCANIATGDVIWSIPVDSQYQVFSDD